MEARRFLFAAGFAWAAPLLGVAHAQAEPRSASPVDASVEPPRLVQAADAEYPESERADGKEGVVVLRLTVDAEGDVTNADVVESAGHGFDQSATHAALRFRFKPARRGDQNVAARILYRLEFRLPATEDAVATPAPRVPVRPATPMASPVRATAGAPTGPAVGTLGSGARGDALGGEHVEVIVQGVAEADRRRQSAEAVTVVDMARAKRESADLGEVLARTQGVGVRRTGGLGSNTRFSLAGLADDQVRFFLDGVPLELVGFPFGVGNVPVNLIDRIDVFSGVVPVRYGADALGGAVDLVTNPEREGTHAAISYETGSFDTHRLTLGAQTLGEDTGRFARVNGFFDSTRNDYRVNVEVPDERGRLSPARVHRFHDGYRAGGANVEVGLINRPWARRLLVRAFLTDYRKEYQHNQVMTVPYGAVTYREVSFGASGRYGVSLGRGVQLELLGGFAQTRGRFRDVGECVYDWFGRCVRKRVNPGETDSKPHDQIYLDRSGYGRLNVTYRPRRGHAFRLTSAPTYLTRTGDELRQADPSRRDPLTAERRLTTVVNGLEHELDLFDDRLENIAFVKQYGQLLKSEEPRPGGFFRRRDRATYRLGFGDALRFRFFDELYAKASYESATRLPRADEVFGDNRFIIANLALLPERSHNANLGLTLDARGTAAGSFRGTVNGFLRDAGDLIVLLGNDRTQSYRNVYGGRSLGAEAAVGWSSPTGLFVWDINATYLDYRNSSRLGTFGRFAGDRIPNRPWLFANYSARVELRDVASPRDELAFGWTTRYVHQYYRGWESVGLRDSKQVIPWQFVHGVAVGYLTRSPSVTFGSTLELQNLTDQPTFDYFGVQRPGRAFYVKTTAEF
jgi:vitamin B12 transporter